MTPLRATVRLQLHEGFDFAAAQAQLDYFAELGISHLYLSPISEALPGSTHGYDGTDPGRIRAALGGEAGFVRLAEAARSHGLGILLDIVPNHLAADPRTPAWADVLAHGRRSAYADWFDIDWEAPGCDGKVWLPVLDRPLEEAVADGLLSVIATPEGPHLQHHDQQWPLSPAGRPTSEAAQIDWIERCNRTPAHLHRLLEHQAYRLAWWRSGPDRVNYRRFFDINGLAALRVEREAVFEAVHALPLRLVREGWVDGLRVDHVDGLADPTGYLRQLRAALDRAGDARGLPAGTLTLHVEKILADGETLPADWACDGTTGYDFMDQVGALLHDPAGAPALDRFWRQVSGTRETFAAAQRRARAELLGSALQGDLDRVLRMLPPHGDLTPRMFERALRALLMHFPVYRTYGLHTDGERALLKQMVDQAGAALEPGDRAALGVVASWLTEPGTGGQVPEVLTRFEQLAAPLNAKAVEDTAFYRYGRLLSRNEVGSDPSRFALAPGAFVQRAQSRGARFPRALLAVATHDHKRGPDARMRLAVLSSWPDAWNAALCRWQSGSARLGHPLPLPGAEAYMLWQALIGAWPLAHADVDGAFAERIAQWLRKALREGKRISRWSDPQLPREDAAVAWVVWLCTSSQADALRAEVGRFALRVAAAGARLSLAQLALQLTAPGVPDLYQGNEGWDTSLVDPDNRRPVDFAQRRAWLADTRPWSELLAHWQEGAVKARLLATLLQLRRTRPLLFSDGALRPVHVSADGARLVLQRCWRQQTLVVAVCLRATAAPSDPKVLNSLTGDDAVPLPGIAPGRYRNLLDGRPWTHAGGGIAVHDLFHGSPAALWFNDVEHDDGR